MPKVDIFNYSPSQTSLIEKQDHQKHQKSSENVSEDGFFCPSKTLQHPKAKKRGVRDRPRYWWILKNDI
jgi:hypothetical protein